MSIPVKFFSSRRSGNAPVLSGSVNSVVALLKACLVTGFNQKTVSSITVSNGVATANIAAHGFMEGEVVAFSGANESVFNSEFRVKANPGVGYIQFDIVGAPSSASGTISAQYAPLGWEETFTNSASKSVFRSKDVSGTRYSLRVVDDGTTASTRNGGAKNALFGMCENVTALDVFDRQKQVFIQKSSTADSTARPWFLVGDGKRFYLGVEWSAGYPGSNYVYFFGDIPSYRAADAHNCMMVGMAANYGTDSDDPGVGTYNTYESAYYFDVGMGADFNFNKATGMYLGRAYHQAGSFIDAINLAGPAGCNRLRMAAATQYFGPPGSSLVPYPNPVDNSVIVTGPMFVQENSNLAIRGTMPGVYMPMHQVKPVNDLFPKVNVGGSLRNMYFAQMSAYGGSLTLRGQLGFDVTGPWE